MALKKPVLQPPTPEDVSGTSSVLLSRFDEYDLTAWSREAVNVELRIAPMLI